MDKKLKLSFCTSCKGEDYFEFLQKTLPANLEAAKDYPNAEFVVLAYGDTPELNEWVKGTYSDEIESGRVKFVYYPDAKHFEMAHAKNMAHRMATGDVLCNLDADNYLGEGFCEFLNERFSENLNIIVSPDSSYMDGDGIGGRVAISADNFIKARGYDNAYANWGPENLLLINRAENHLVLEHVEFSPHSFNGFGVIAHSNDVRVAEMSDENVQKSSGWLDNIGSGYSPLTKKYLDDIELPANLNGNVGCGTLYINFSDKPTVIEPLPPIERQYEVKGDNAHAVDSKKEPYAGR